MYARHAWLLVLAVVFAASLIVVGQATQAQSVSSPNASLPLNPIGLQRGQSLLGANYPQEAQRVRRAAPPDRVVAAPGGVDLDVTFINRAPMYRAYCVQYLTSLPSLCPGTETEQRWPAPGEVVTFTAHVVNKGTSASPSFAYRWDIDGGAVLSGTLSALAPSAEITTTYQWTWAHALNGEQIIGDHTVRFIVDPANAISETYEINNSLEDRTNALSLRIAITPQMVEAYNTPWNPAFSYSAEDWLQRQIAAMNWAFANSIYAVTPQGATERVRINMIEVVNGASTWDGVNDGGWFVDADYRTYSGGYDAATDIDWSLVHELSHQIGLIDLYALDLEPSLVKALEQEGNLVNIGFRWPYGDLMGGGDITPYTDQHLYSSHSAAGLSSTKGYRRGYYGEYQFDIPQQNFLRILDNQGQPAADVQVSIYQREGPRNWMGDLMLDNAPEITGTTDINGRLALTNRSVDGGVTTATGHTLSDNPFGVVDIVGGRNRFLMKINQGLHEEFTWLNITAFNLAYWQGDTVSHTFAISSHVPISGAPLPPLVPTAKVEGSQAMLSWTASPSAEVVGYFIYRAVPPTYAYERISGLVNSLTYTDTYNDGDRLYAITAMDTISRESGFSHFVWTPHLGNPTAIGLLSDGRRIILDPDDGYALMHQRSDGRYIESFGSQHYHLEWTHFLAVDARDRLIFSHPGDAYGGRQSIRVADQNADPIMEFGSAGSGNGQVQNPAGVAVWGQDCTINPPYADDAHTLLLLHFDGNYDGTQGESGWWSGTAFTAGKAGQGVLFDSDDTLSYPTIDNLNRTQGSIEFWFRPAWNGGDTQSYTLFEVGNTWFNRLRIMKDGANNLRFMMWDSTTEYNAAYNVGHWAAGEWHHIAALWQADTIALYVDGQLRDSRSGTHVPDVLAPAIHIGSSTSDYSYAAGVIDEFRISAVPRVGACGSQPYRILVADSGNNRIQAFDDAGNFVAAFGSAGSGSGQFNSPQGLAVDRSGRVIVADSNNHRLQVLNFDGTTFSVNRIITANFSLPIGVAVDRLNRLVVADTGQNRIKVLDLQGNVLAQYTAPNDGYSGSFNQPRGVAVDRNQTIIVADTGNRRVVTIAGALPVIDTYLPLVARPAPQNLLINGGFEQGLAVWQWNDFPLHANVGATVVHSGSYAARLGIEASDPLEYSYATATYPFGVLPTAPHIRLAFWYWPRREGLAGDPQHSRQFAYVLEGNTTLQILFEFDENLIDWQYAEFDLSPYAGKSISIQFGVYHDGNAVYDKRSALYVDDVSLTGE